MKRISLILPLLAVAALFAWPTPSNAASPSLLDSKRFSAAIGLDREMLISYPLLKERWAGVGALAYNVLSPSDANPHAPRLAITFRYSQPFELSNRPSGTLGIRYTLPFGGGKYGN